MLKRKILQFFLPSLTFRKRKFRLIHSNLSLIRLCTTFSVEISFKKLNRISWLFFLKNIEFMMRFNNVLIFFSCVNCWCFSLDINGFSSLKFHIIFSRSIIIYHQMSKCYCWGLCGRFGGGPCNKIEPNKISLYKTWSCLVAYR